MFQTEYVRNLNCNYERILLDRMPEEKKYQYCILNRGGIKGLLPCGLRYINGFAYLYYDISSKQNLAQLYGNGNLTREWLKDFMWGMQRVGQELERFLLDTHNIIWYPEQIFQDLENNVFSFLYLPYYEGESSFGFLLEFLVEHVDYNDEALVELVYHMYEQYEKNGDLYLQAQIFEDMKRLDEAERQQERVTDVEEAVTECSTEQSDCGNRKGLRGIFDFDARRKKSREQREDYRQSLHRTMEGLAVAEESAYEGEPDEEAEYGRTVYVEIKEDEQGKVRGLYFPDGRLLSHLERASFTIGKKKEEADLILEDSSISRMHARIVKEKEYYYLEDMNSTNGTFKNGLRLQPYEKRRLEEGDDIRFGRVLLVFR